MHFFSNHIIWGEHCRNIFLSVSNDLKRCVFPSIVLLEGLDRVDDVRQHTMTIDKMCQFVTIHAKLIQYTLNKMIKLPNQIRNKEVLVILTLVLQCMLTNPPIQLNLLVLYLLCCMYKG